MQILQDDPNTAQLVTQSTMARLLQCSPRTIANLCRRKAIPYIKVGRLIRFRPDIVIEALAEASPRGGKP